MRKCTGRLVDGGWALSSILCLMVALPAQGTGPQAEGVGRMPLGFLPNVGQAPKFVVFEARGVRGTLAFQNDGVLLTLPREAPATTKDPRRKSGSARTAAIGLRIVGAGTTCIAAKGATTGRANFFIGNDQTRWRRDIPISRGVIYEDIYKGIDLHYDGVDGRLKGTWYLDAGVDPSLISWRYSGVASQSLAPNGDIVLTLPRLLGVSEGQIVEEAPIAWQLKTVDGQQQRTPVKVVYSVAEDGTIGFRCGDYDRAMPLVIDPFIDYSTLLGGNGTDNGSAIAIDAQGRCLITGRTHSTTLGGGPAWPVQNPLMGYGGEIADVFLTRISQDGSQLDYSTYIGGGDPFDLTVAGGTDWGIDLALESDGSVWVVGMTESVNFPITTNALQTAHAGGSIDGFLLKVNAAGDNLEFSSYIGGGGLDYAFSVAVDSQDVVHVVGSTSSFDFPVTPGAHREVFDGVSDAFLTILDFNGAGGAYSTFVGFEGEDTGMGVAVDDFGLAYVVGATDSMTDASTVLPSGVNPYQPLNGGGADAFLAVIDPAGNGMGDLVYFSYLGGEQADSAWDVAVDSQGIPHLVGVTGSADFPVLNNQLSYAGGTDGFMARISPQGFGGLDLQYSILLGGFMDDGAMGISILNDAAYVTGLFHSFISQDAFIVKVNAVGNLIDGSIFGGSQLDVGFGVAATLQGIYIIGQTQCDQPILSNPNHVNCSHSFPSVGAVQGSFGGGWTDAFVTRFTLF